MQTPLLHGGIPPLPTSWRHTRVTVMGLGSFGGGVGLTRYLVRQGAQVTVTDLQGAEALAASLEALRGLPIHFVLGGHRSVIFVRRMWCLSIPRSPSLPRTCN